jgi:hypothetical protein
VGSIRIIDHVVVTDTDEPVGMVAHPPAGYVETFPADGTCRYELPP